MVVLGLDVGKDSLAACFLLPAPSGAITLPAVPNTQAGFKALLRFAHQHDVVPADLHVVMEATSVYWEECATALHEARCTVSVENPAQIKYFARSILRRGKTDCMDAETIARYGATRPPKAWHPPDQHSTELKLLVRERTALTTTVQQERNRRHAMEHRSTSSPTLLTLVDERIELLEQQIKAIEAAMKQLLAGHARLEPQMRLLLSVPGFGFLSAVSVLAETDGFSAIETGAQLCAFCGIAPSPVQSGTSVRGRGRISKMGNAHLRRTAYLAALGAAHSHGRLGVFYQHLRLAGKPPKVARIALARKLLRVGLAVVKSGQPYQEDYQRPEHTAA
ncbi:MULTISPECIES: IS110 family transposase [Deinococcus]|uniref:IS110 family transposase n=1 Tax=Deinococcus rufus TaxID=2136097 RepID=A0ABV7Z9U0_9DEIO|nr:IS110 family transposase [Deinococcus sp. AB2017081]WQE97181.1 IS110 family transposase [Deinococcus sp. AB2017081]